MNDLSSEMLPQRGMFFLCVAKHLHFLPTKFSFWLFMCDKFKWDRYYSLNWTKWCE